jgi:predicted transcriptional regulator
MQDYRGYIREEYLKLTGKIVEAVILNQMVYWSKKYPDRMWQANNYDQFREQCGLEILTKQTIKNHINALEKKGLIKRNGIYHYKVNKRKVNFKPKGRTIKFSNGINKFAESLAEGIILFQLINWVEKEKNWLRISYKQINERYLFGMYSIRQIQTIMQRLRKKLHLIAEKKTFRQNVWSYFVNARQLMVDMAQKMKIAFTMSVAHYKWLNHKKYPFAVINNLKKRRGELVLA